ncbi:hypothetical protein VTO42DRAFT_3174 [Malbranchea cinnamomea]
MVKIDGGRRCGINMFCQIYINYADDMVMKYMLEGKPEKISRSQIEMQILSTVDNTDFPTPYRLAMFSMVAHTDIFDIYWQEKRSRYGLSNDSTARVKPDYTLIFDLPSVNPPDSPIESPRSSSVETILPDDAPAFEWEEFDLGKWGLNQEGGSLKGASEDSNVHSVAIVDQPARTPEVTPGPDPAKKKRTYKKRPEGPRSTQNKRGRPSRKALKEAEAIVDGTGMEQQSADCGTMNEENVSSTPQQGQTGGKTVGPEMMAATKRARGTSSRGHRGKARGGSRGVKRVRFDFS